MSDFPLPCSYEMVLSLFFFSYGPTSSDILRLEGTGSWWLVGDSRNGLSQDLRPTIAYTFGMW